MTTFETSEHLTTKLHNDGTLELAGLEETHWMTKKEAVELALHILESDYENGDFDHCKFCEGWIKVHEEEAKPKPILSDSEIGILKNIVSQNGKCEGIYCVMCPLHHASCILYAQDNFEKAKQMLKELEG